MMGNNVEILVKKNFIHAFHAFINRSFLRWVASNSSQQSHKYKHAKTNTPWTLMWHRTWFLFVGMALRPSAKNILWVVSWCCNCLLLIFFWIILTYFEFFINAFKPIWHVVILFIIIFWFYCTQHEFLWPFFNFRRDFGRYFSKYVSCFALIAPRRLLKKISQKKI